MRQVFFLLLAAMVVAFSLSWASSEKHVAVSYQVLPQEVVLPASLRPSESIEIVALVPLSDTCERITEINQDFEMNRVIISILVSGRIDSLCRQNLRSNVSVNILVPTVPGSLSKRTDVFFKEESGKLKYFGSVDIETKLISRN